MERKTFYLHYTSIEALYEDILSELSKDYYQAIDQLLYDAPFTEINRVFFEFMAVQEPYMGKSSVTHPTRNFLTNSSCQCCSTTGHDTTRTQILHLHSCGRFFVQLSIPQGVPQISQPFVIISCAVLKKSHLLVQPALLTCLVDHISWQTSSD